MTDKIIEKIWLEDRNTALGFMYHELLKAPKEDLEDIFTDSMEVLQSKYIEPERVSTQEHARKVLYGIIKIHIKKYKRLKADEAWIDLYKGRFDQGQSFDEFISANRSNVQLNPPSIYYSRDYYQRTKPERQEWYRSYYKKNREKFRELSRADPRRKERTNKYKKKKYWETKADPEAYQELKDKYNANRRRRNAEKKAGIWKDRRVKY